jgi:hypothetical protein
MDGNSNRHSNPNANANAIANAHAHVDPSPGKDSNSPGEKTRRAQAGGKKAEQTIGELRQKINRKKQEWTQESGKGFDWEEFNRQSANKDLYNFKKAARNQAEPSASPSPGPGAGQLSPRPQKSSLKNYPGETNSNSNSNSNKRAPLGAPKMRGGDPKIPEKGPSKKLSSSASAPDQKNKLKKIERTQSRRRTSGGVLSQRAQASRVLVEKALTASERTDRELAELTARVHAADHHRLAQLAGNDRVRAGAEAEVIDEEGDEGSSTLLTRSSALFTPLKKKHGGKTPGNSSSTTVTPPRAHF